MNRLQADASGMVRADLELAHARGEIYWLSREVIRHEPSPYELMLLRRQLRSIAVPRFPH